MTPVGNGVISLTKFYGLGRLPDELALIGPGMSLELVRALLGKGHHELADDLVLYSEGGAIDDPLLQACRARSPAAPILTWVALVMSDHRLAAIVETFLTDQSGRLIPDRFNTDSLETALRSVLPGRTRKSATNILSYLRDSRLVEPVTVGGTIVGIEQELDTSPFVRDAVRYIIFRLQHLEITYRLTDKDVDAVIAIQANHWLNLTGKQFRYAFINMPPDSEREPPPPPRTPGPPPPVATEVGVEANNTESFEVSGQSPRTRVRREQPLVLDYGRWMEARGSVVVRHRLRPPGASSNLYSDLYDKTRNNLIEAKTDASRPSIRMAIGQLMDYRRFLPGPAKLAVLTERRPPRDLEALLKSLQIACIWRAGDRFVDNAKGTFS